MWKFWIRVNAVSVPYYTKSVIFSDTLLNFRWKLRSSSSSLQREWKLQRSSPLFHLAALTLYILFWFSGTNTSPTKKREISRNRHCFCQPRTCIGDKQNYKKSKMFLANLKRQLTSSICKEKVLNRLPTCNRIALSFPDQLTVLSSESENTFVQVFEVRGEN